MKIRFFGDDVAAPATLRPAGAEARRSARIAAKVDRPAPARPRSCCTGSTPAVVQARAGRVLDREAAGAAIVGALASLDARRRRCDAADSRSTQPRVTGARLARARLAEARTAVSAPVVLTLGPKRVPDPALAGRRPAQAARRTARRSCGSAGPGRTRSSRRKQKRRRHPVARRRSSSSPEAESGCSRPSMPACSTCPKTAEALLAAALAPTEPHRADRRRDAAGEADDRGRARRWGSPASSRATRRTYGGVPEPDPQRRGRLAPRRQHPDRAAQGVLVQRHDR